VIVDSHSHAWARWPYDADVPDAPTRGSAEQLIFEMNQHGVDRALVVAAGIEYNPDNNTYVAEAVRRYPDRLLHVADVDCTWSEHYHRPGAADRLRDVIEKYNPVGFTHYVRSENDGWMVSEEGMEFFGVAAENNLIASLAVSPDWQDDIRTVAREFPSMPILCHHLAGIRASGNIADGLEKVLPSVEYPNIYIKVSGFYYGAERPWDFPYPEAIEVVRTLYRSFGASRLLWASDFPASRRCITYTQSVEMVRTHCSFIDAKDLPGIMGDNMQAVLESLGRGGNAR